MPVIARFSGIVIKMYYSQAEHNPPHIHAQYGEHNAAISIDSDEILDGSIPIKQYNMIKKWMAKKKEAVNDCVGNARFSSYIIGGVSMFHKVNQVEALPGYKLSVMFAEGITKLYDMNPIFEKWKQFKSLKKDNDIFESVKVEGGGYGISWNDELDLSCNELFENGEKIDTPFDGLMSFADATFFWELNESTLRKAIVYGKLIKGIDVRKFGKQWVVSMDAMKREYGNPAK